VSSADSSSLQRKRIAYRVGTGVAREVDLSRNVTGSDSSIWYENTGSSKFINAQINNQDSKL